MRYSVLAGLLLAASVASAQTSRAVYPLQVWPEAQGELALRNGDYLLLALHGERQLQDGNYDDRPLGFDVRRALLAYEHFISSHWSYGATFRYEGYGDGFNGLAPEALLRHRSPVFAGITFGQRLSLEFRKDLYPSRVNASSPDGQVWGRLRVDLERVLPLSAEANGPALRPRLSAEASTHVRLQKADSDPLERTIQYTSLRADVGLRVSPRFDFTPWFAYQTFYYKSLPQYDANGNLKSGGDSNAIVPTAGLDLRFTFLPSGAKADRQQLPTQH